LKNGAREMGGPGGPQGGGGDGHAGLERGKEK